MSYVINNCDSGLLELDPSQIEGENVSSLRRQFENAEPFHHLVIDQFLDPLLAIQLECELRNLPEKTWVDESSAFHYINNQQDGPTQSKKVALNDRAKIPSIATRVIDFFQSPAMLSFLSSVTGIEEPLLADETMLGGGVHRTTAGGKLAIHCDFNLHPTTGKHRRLNALLYLNTGWKPEHQGELELWPSSMEGCLRKIEPLSNRLVIFRIRDDALHGHPEPWRGSKAFPRMSLALYYYTDDRPEGEKAPFHWARWFPRFGDHY